MSKKDIHVVTHPAQGWATRTEGAARMGSTHGTQASAIEAARHQATRARVEVVIHRPNGKIRDSDSYGRDGMPPRDRKH